MGASSSAMHASSRKQQRQQARHDDMDDKGTSSAVQPAEIPNPHSSNHDMTLISGMMDTDSADEKAVQLPQDEDSSSILMKELKKLQLSDHNLKSAENIIQKNDLLSPKLLDCLQTANKMKSENFEDSALDVEKMNYNFFNIPIEKRSIVGEFLKLIDFAPMSFKVYKKALKKVDNTSYAEEITDEATNEWTQLMRTLWWNYSDCSILFASSLASIGIIHEMLEDLKILKNLEEKRLNYSNAFESAIGILHNIAKNDEHRQIYRDLNAVEILGVFLKHENVPKVTMLVLLTLALIIDESQTDLLFSHESGFSLLIRMSKRASKSQDHRYDGFSLDELLLGLKGLSRNDKVKRLLVEKDILPLILQVLKDGKDDEKILAAQLLWELSFDATNQDAIFKDKSIMETLKSMSTLKGKIAQSAQGVMWTLDTHKKKLDTNKGEPSSTEISSNKANFKGHVMISYNWNEQKRLIKVKESLKSNGFKVWMDIDNIKGSTLQAMAEAVEGAACVLVCMSERYKESVNCRSEAEYAFSLGKPIIPLLMQDAYKPDGWLGILLGTKLFFDFSGKFQFDSKLSELLKELKGLDLLSNADETDGPIVKTTAVVVSKTPAKKTVSNVEMKQWVINNKLEKFSCFGSLQPKHIEFLKSLSENVPEFYFKFLSDLLCNKTTVGDVEALMQASNAVKNFPS